MGLGCIQAVFRIAFLLVFVVEDGVRNDMQLFSAKFQQREPAVVALSRAVLANSGVEVTKSYDLVICRGALKEALKIQIELVIFRRFSLKGGRKDTKERGMLQVS